MLAAQRADDESKTPTVTLEGWVLPLNDIRTVPPPEPTRDLAGFNRS